MRAACASSSVPLHHRPACSRRHNQQSSEQAALAYRRAPGTGHRIKLLLYAFLDLMRSHALAARVRRVFPLLAFVVLLLAATSDGIRPTPGRDVKAPVQRTLQGEEAGRGKTKEAAERTKGFLQEEVYATGSSLPDCSHACGACKPCNRVKVSFKCSIAEPCPMVYRCMCKGKCYPVPSS